MANKKAEKTVNVRKTSSGSEAPPRRRGREYCAILLVSLAIFLALCLLSYDPSDPSFNVVTDKSDVSNLCGLIGSHVGDAFVQLLGICALLIPVVLAGTALRIYRNVSEGRNLPGTIAALLLLASVCMLVERLIHTPFLGFSLEHTGGALGSFLHYYLSGLLGSVGEMLVGGTVILICILNLSKVSLSTVFQLIRRAAGACTDGLQKALGRLTDGAGTVTAGNGRQESPARHTGSMGSAGTADVCTSRKAGARGKGPGDESTRNLAGVPVPGGAGAGETVASRETTTSAENTASWMSVPIPESHPSGMSGSRHSVERGKGASTRDGSTRVNGNGKTRGGADEARASVASVGLATGAGAKGGSRATRGAGRKQSTHGPDFMHSIPIMDDYEAPHGEWLDAGETGPLPIDDDFLQAKGAFVEPDQVASNRGAKRAGGKGAPHTGGSAAQTQAGRTSASRSRADELPHIDWTGLDEITTSLEICNDSLDVGAAAAEITETDSPAVVRSRQSCLSGSPHVVAETEDDAGVSPAESGRNHSKKRPAKGSSPAGSVRNRDRKPAHGSSTDDGELPHIEWDDQPAAPKIVRSQGDAAKHVQVSRRADENMEPSDSEESLTVAGDEYRLPSTDLLDPTPQSNRAIDERVLQENAKVLEQKLRDLKIEGRVVAVHPGPVITMFELALAPGIPLRKVLATADDLAMALKSGSTRVVAPIPGKDTVGIEVPNLNREIVYFREIVESRSFRKSDAPLKLALGKGIDGEPFSSSLTKMPHLLIAGATGTGKSVGLNSLICSWLITCHPDDLKLLMVDPKKLELSYYQDIPHLLHPVVTEPEKVPAVLSWAIREMERRYDLLSEAGAKNIEGYNEKVMSEQAQDATEGDPPQKLPYIVIIVDELAELMMVAAKDIEISIARLAQMARASGIHLILATQRPSVDVITGVIKANFPARLSYQVSAKADSRTILDTVGAENLLGRGDMLFLPPGTAKLQRLHGAYISEKEISRVCEFIKTQRKPVYLKEITKQVDEEGTKLSGSDLIDDEKYDEAVDLVTRLGHASISLIQRHMRIGYNRAARIIEAMETEGIIGPSDGTSRPREVLVGSLDHIPDQPRA